MLYYLFNWLDTLNVPGAGLFDYISFRASMALIFSLIISVGIGKRIIKLLASQQIGETVRDLGLTGQVEKAGTPTMGAHHFECHPSPYDFIRRTFKCLCHYHDSCNHMARTYWFFG